MLSIFGERLAAHTMKRISFPAHVEAINKALRKTHLFIHGSTLGAVYMCVARVFKFHITREISGRQLRGADPFFLLLSAERICFQL